jgi:hypothetical protein
LRSVTITLAIVLRLCIVGAASAALLGLAMLEAGEKQERRAARVVGVFEPSASSAAGWPLEGF